MNYNKSSPNFLRACLISSFSLSEKSIWFLLPSIPRSLCLTFLISGQYEFKNLSRRRKVRAVSLSIDLIKIVRENNNVPSLSVSDDRRPITGIIAGLQFLVKISFYRNSLAFIVGDIKKLLCHIISFVITNIVTIQLLTKFILIRRRRSEN